MFFGIYFNTENDNALQIKHEEFYIFTLGTYLCRDILNVI